ncbi:type III-A CRISPR-associated RAMP protein Csm4 [Caminibacter mediatlanticus]|uniref:CRISPR system Cms protein Csm4 n=1 Tax=Caminibacter mediatlanticus TB-2 TaxID=391592 RepID=A0AAI9AGD5_9BACT|nr:hypothetical protein [Caminibacter mediatlanticus]EDM23131.1 hypothetical protein CMTB2_05847 [Caminibacter mediatlanticus TB-2]
MELAKLKLKPISSFITPIHSDTLFGHFAWGILFLYGEERLKDFLKNSKIVFSNGFFKDYLPKPYLKPKVFDLDKIDKAKKYKKISQIPKEVIFNNIDNLNDEVIFEEVIELDMKKEIKSSITQKNSINRNSNIVNEGLYSIKEVFINEEMDIYFAYENISKKKIEEVIALISKRGYGKDKSAGKGKFKFEIDWDFEDKKYFKENERYISLSNAFYNKDNMKLYLGKTFTKFPKTGGYLAYSKPFKNPVMMYEAGSVFIARDFIFGKMENAFNEDGYFHNGLSIGLGFRGK